MIHKGSKRLETERLILRRFKEEDAKMMFNNWANDPEVTRFLSWEPHGSLEVTKALLSSWVEGYKNLDNYNWAIVYDEDLVGSISLVAIDEEVAGAEVGYCMSRRYWGRGIMAEALSAVLAYCFDELAFKEMYAKHHVDNPNSGKVMKKAGMEYVKTEKASLSLNKEKQVMCDCYEILNK